MLAPHLLTRRSRVGSLVGPSTTWNPADKSAGVTLSGANLIATRDGSAGDAGARSISSKTTGKWVYEVVFNYFGGNIADTGAGIALASATFPGLGSNGALGAMIFVNNGPGYLNTVRAITVGSWGANPGIGMMTALDMVNNKVWFTASNAGGAWNGNLGGDPATNSLGLSLSGIPGAMYAACVMSGGAAGQAFTANFAGPFICAVPSGFLPWGT